MVLSSIVFATLIADKLLNMIPEKTKIRKYRRVTNTLIVLQIILMVSNVTINIFK